MSNLEAMPTTLDDIRRTASSTIKLDDAISHTTAPRSSWQNETLLHKEQHIIICDSSFMPLAERREHAIVQLTKFYNSIEPFVFVYGGIGDALLALSEPLDTMQSFSVVACMNSVKSMETLMKMFPKIHTVYAFPKIEDYTTMLYFRHHTIHHPKCIAHGITSDNLEHTLWNEQFRLDQQTMVRMYPEWVKQFPVEPTLSELSPYCVLAPKGSLHGMHRSKRNIIRPHYWKPLLRELHERGITPVVIGLPDDEEWYPLSEHCIDKRSYSLDEQMRILRGARLVIAADSWHKTFAAMAEIPSVVFAPVTGIDLQGIKDNSQYVFLDPWKEVSVTSSFTEVLTLVDTILGKVNHVTPLNTYSIREPKRRTNPNQPLSMYDAVFHQDYQHAQTVLLRASSALGDSLMLTAIINELHQQYPHLTINVSGTDAALEVFRFNTTVNRVVPINTPAEFALEAEADIVVDYNHIIDCIKEYYNQAHFMDILAAIAGIELSSKSLHYTVTATDALAATTLCKEVWAMRPPLLIGIHCHTHKDLKRSYPYTVELISTLKTIFPNMGFIHFGNHRYENMSSAGILDCAQREIPLRTQIALARECDAFITIDSAFFHIAHNLFALPTLLLQSVTNECLIGNLENAIVRVVRSGRTNCTPCYWSCKQHCLSQIHPAELAHEFTELLRAVSLIDGQHTP